MQSRPQPTLGACDVHVWHVLAEQVADPCVLDSAGPLVSDQELARAQRFRRECDRRLFLLSRALMRSVLAHYLSCSGEAIEYTLSAFGKPIVCHNGSAAPVRFNLTHSKGAVALAVSGEREVGIDIEERQRPVEYLALAERFFASPEAQHLSALMDEQRRDAFFAIWTLKEAYVKGIGQGLTFPLDAFCFELDVDRLLAFRPLADFVARDWHFQQFDISPHHCGALAVHNPKGEELCVAFHDWPTAFGFA